MIKNKQSDEWLAVKKHTVNRLNELRENNDNLGLDDVDTAILRGQILFAKEILGLEESQEETPKLFNNNYID